MKKITAIIIFILMLFSLLILPASAETETEWEIHDVWADDTLEPLPAGDPWYARGYILVTVPEGADDEYYRSREAYPEIEISGVGRLVDGYGKYDDGRYVVGLKEQSFSAVNDAVEKLSPRVGKDLIKVERDTENVFYTDEIRDFTDIYEDSDFKFEIIVGVIGWCRAYPDYGSVDAYPELDLTGVKCLMENMFLLQLRDQTREGVIEALEKLNARSGKDLEWAEPNYLSVVELQDIPNDIIIPFKLDSTAETSAPAETAAPAAQPPAPQPVTAPRTADGFAVTAAVLAAAVIACLCIGAAVLKKKGAK